MPKRIFAVLYVSVMGLTRCYKTTVFFKFIHRRTDDFLLRILLAKNAVEFRKINGVNFAHYAEANCLFWITAYYKLYCLIRAFSVTLNSFLTYYHVHN